MRKRLTHLRIPTGGETTAAMEIVVEDGKIAALHAPGRGPVEEDLETVDLGGMLVLPGAIDGHVHFDDPGFTHREDFESGTRAAAAGGVTCIVDMPCTSLPPVTTLRNLHAKLNVIRPKARVDYMLWGGASDNALEEQDWRRNLAEIADAGVASIKIYLLSGMETFRDLSRIQAAEVLREATALGIPVGVHAEDREMVRGLETHLRMQGRTDPLDYAASRPPAAEVAAVETMRDLCRETGARVHIVHLAAGRALDIVSEARDEGLPLSAETCPHFLEFTAGDLETLGSLLKTAPVVKSPSDRSRLWQGILTGEIEFVATDHAAGQWPNEKRTGSIWTDYGGVPGVELFLPYLFSEAVRKGRIHLERLTEITASAPARFFGVANRKGRLEVGFDADLAVLDPAEAWTVRSDELHNLNRYTPLDGYCLDGRVRSTYVRGAKVFERLPDGTEWFGEAGYGEWVRREQRVGE